MPCSAIKRKLSIQNCRTGSYPLAMAPSSSSAAIRFILLLLPLFSIPCLSVSHEPPSKPKSITLPIQKDPLTNMFYTTVGIGTPQPNSDLVIDLAGDNLWHECKRRKNSSSYQAVDCESNKCPKDAICASSGCAGPVKPSCNISYCLVTITNPLAQFTSSTPLVEDALFFTRGPASPHLLSGCIDFDGFLTGGNALLGLPKTSKGVIGLSRSKLSLPTQLFLANKLPPKFSLCLPSSKKKGFGNIFIGGEPQVESKFLHETPLIVNPSSSEYFIDVKSIKIDGGVVNYDKKGNGGSAAKISTLTPFTELHSSLYKPFVQDFITKAVKRRMKRVASVPPFGACFDSSTIGNSVTGLVVPSIDLVLLGGVEWRIYGGNSMVKMRKKNVACLAFVDGGTKARTTIVIGGHQLEDNVLVFDVASSKLRFSSSLLQRNASCSSHS